MIDGFLHYLQYEKCYSTHTVFSYAVDLRQFYDYCTLQNGDFNVLLVSPVLIQQWVLSLLESGVSTRSVNRKISSLKAFWRYLLHMGKMSVDPTLKIVLPKTNKPIPVFFTEKEMELVVGSSNVPNSFVPLRNHTIMLLFYQTGIRLSELISMNDEDVDYSLMVIRVVGKRNKQRMIPIGEGMLQSLRIYQSERDKNVERFVPNLFVRENGRAMYSKMVYNIVCLKMDGVTSQQKRSPHALRHTFATAMLNGGADIASVKELLGHSSLAATQIYTHTSFEELNKIYINTHPRAK